MGRNANGEFWVPRVANLHRKQEDRRGTVDPSKRTLQHMVTKAYKSEARGVYVSRGGRSVDAKNAKPWEAPGKVNTRAHDIQPLSPREAKLQGSVTEKVTGIGGSSTSSPSTSTSPMRPRAGEGHPPRRQTTGGYFAPASRQAADKITGVPACSSPRKLLGDGTRHVASKITGCSSAPTLRAPWSENVRQSDPRRGSSTLHHR